MPRDERARGLSTERMFDPAILLTFDPQQRKDRHYAPRCAGRLCPIDHLRVRRSDRDPNQTGPARSQDPERTRVGRLEYRGGLQLSSPDQRFGGLSGLLVAADGTTFVAISDEGWLITGRLLYDGAGRLAGVGGGAISPLRSQKGEPLASLGKTASDAESLARDAHGGFEHRHRIVRYPSGAGPPSIVASPEGLDRAPANAGLEALTRLADGRLLALTEGLQTMHGVMGWVGRPSAWRVLTWRTSEGFSPTDAASLPGGEVLVLERRFPPIGVRLRLLPAAAITRGAAPPAKPSSTSSPTTTTAPCSERC
jgi:hypothetical protein